MSILIILQFTGKENYENQMKYGQEVFHELEYLNENGINLQGIEHKITVLSCSD